MKVNRSPYVQFIAPPLPHLLECGRSDYKPGDTHPNRRNIGVFDMIIIRSGVLYIGEEQMEWAMKPGDMVLLRPDAWHYSVRPCEVETSFYWLHIQTAGSWRVTDTADQVHPDRERRGAASPYVYQFPKYGPLPHPEPIYDLLETMLQASSEPRSYAFWQQQTAFVELLRQLDIRLFADRNSPAVTLAEQTEAYLKNNYRAPISNEMLSHTLHFHHNYISRCMKQVYGVTPQEYLLRYRLDQAKLLLLRTDWPIARIAEEVGFEHAAYFTRRFTEHVGHSPREYRQRYVQGQE
jgi:AraC-like DNA-binding protein